MVAGDHPVPSSDVTSPQIHPHKCSDNLKSALAANSHSTAPHSLRQGLQRMTTLNLENLIAGDDRQFIPFPSRRSVVYSTRGIISSTQPLANEAGYKILAQGGNAADAAVAVAAALNVTGPSSLKCN